MSGTFKLTKLGGRTTSLVEPLSRRYRVTAACRASVVKNRQEVELPQTRGIGEYIDFDNLPTPDREAHNRIRPSTRSHDDSRGSVYQRRSCKGREL